MNQKFVVKRSDLIWIIVFTFFLLQNPLSLRISTLKYVDELTTVFFGGYTLLSIIAHKHFDKTFSNMYMMIGILVIIGLVSTFFAGLNRSLVMVGMDIMYLFKVFICFIGADMYFDDKRRQGSILKMLAVEVRILVWAGFICMILSYFGNLGMTRGERYGIKCFHFIYKNPGMFSQYCIIFLLILTAELGVRKLTLYKGMSICALIVIWLSTLRSRAFVIVFAWLFIILISKRDELFQGFGNNTIIKRILKPRNLVIISIVSWFIASSAVTRYFGNETDTARNLLLQGGLRIMKDYFPLGAGFASFGTEAAAQYYSPLYRQYGLNSYWALAEGGTELTDCYWPAICGELGTIGLVLMVILIFTFLRKFLRISSVNKYFTIAALTYIVFLLVSSTATGTFASYVTAEFIVILVAIAKTGRKKGLDI